MIPKKPLASEIAAFLGAELHGPDIQVVHPQPIDEADPGAVCFVNPGASWLSRPDVLFLTDSTVINLAVTHIVVPNPRLAFARVLKHYFVDIGEAAIHPLASVHGSVHMGLDCRLKAGAIVGEDGFGFEKDEKGSPVRIPHIGGVVIGYCVEIGANTVIARGTMGNTIIGNDVKIDDNVFIAHNVRIGNRTMVVAGAVVCGSVWIGPDVWVGAGARIREHLTIGHEAVIGMGAVVVKDVPPGVTVVGNPARELK